jgi:DNA polymerase-3 subunit beta
MKFKVDRAIFLKALNHAQSVVERRTTVPILSHVLLQAKDGVITLTATDLDLSYTQDLAAEVSSPGQTTIPAHMLYDIVRKMPVGQPLEIGTSSPEGHVSISCGRSEFSLPALNGEEFPVFQQESLPFTFEINTKSLIQLIDATRFAMATEETRYYLNGLYWHTCPESGKLRIVATDGHRLSRSEVDLPAGAAGMPGVIVSRKTIGEIRKIIDEADEALTISLSESQMRFSFGSVVMISRLIDGTFPDYQRVIPEHNDRSLIVDAKAFAEAVDRVSILTNERSRGVKMSVHNGALTLSVTTTESGSAREDLNAEYEHESVEIGFNARYVIDINGHLTGPKIEFLLSDASAPVIIRDLGNLHNLFVLMPMRV